MSEGFYKPKRGTDYWTVSGGNIVKRVDEGTPGAISRALEKGDNKGKLVWEIHEEAYEGKIRSVYVDKSDNPQYDDKLCIRFGKATVQMPVTSQHALSVICKLRNINLEEPILFEPYKMAKQGKPGKYNVGVVIRQNGEKVKNHLDPSKDGDLPELEQKKRAGKIEWDSTARDNFLYEHLVEWIAEQQFPDPKHIKDDEHEADPDTETEEEEDDAIPPF